MNTELDFFINSLMRSVGLQAYHFAESLNETPIKERFGLLADFLGRTKPEDPEAYRRLVSDFDVIQFLRAEYTKLGR